MSDKYTLQKEPGYDTEWISAPNNGGDVGDMRDVCDELNRLREIANGLMRTCYDEANRLANHGSNGLEKLVMRQLYDAANAAKDGLNSDYPYRVST